MRDEHGLSPKMRLFADEWLTGAETGKRFHGGAAYEYAGYSVDGANPYSNASKLLRHPAVKKYIEKRMEEFTMSATEVLMRLTDVARANVGDTVRKNDFGNLELDVDAVIQNRDYIKHFKFDSTGRPQVEFHDPMAALKDIMRALGMNKDGLELSGTGGGAVQLQVQFVGVDGNTVNPNPNDESAEPLETYDEFEE